MSKYCKPMGLYVTYMDCLECEGKECMGKAEKSLKTQNTKSGDQKICCYNCKHLDKNRCKYHQVKTLDKTTVYRMFGCNYNGREYCVGWIKKENELKMMGCSGFNKTVLKCGDVFRIWYGNGTESPQLCYLGTIKSNKGTRLVHQHSKAISNGIFLILKDNSLKGKQIRYVGHNKRWKDLRKQYKESVICW